MKITVTAVYRGANLFAPMSVVRQTVDMGDMAGRTAEELGPAFADNMRACLPGLDLEGANLLAILGRASVALQNLVGAGVSYSAAHPASDPGVWHVVYAYENRGVGQRAGPLALDLMRHLLAADLEPEHRVAADFDFVRTRDLFTEWARQRTVGAYTALLVKAAEARDIPWFARSQTATMIQLGQGCYQKRFADYLTSDTSYVGYLMAADKALTHGILRGLALPVAPQRLIGSEEDAVRAAADIGYPVVVKPNGLGKSQGVTAGVDDGAGVRAAFAEASHHDPAVIVERFIPGSEYRMLVVGDEMVDAYERVPPRVVGDGVLSIAELVDKVNREEGRGAKFSLTHYRRLELDDKADRLLAGAGYSRASVPNKGETVRLSAIPGMGIGGTARQVTGQVHPDNRVMAVRAAKAIGLDIAGIDFITPDIGRSYRDVGGGICEVNRTPGIRGHLATAEGDPPDVLGAVLDSLYPPGAPSRVPVAAVAGGTGTAAAARLLAHVLGTAGRTVGLAAGGAVTVGGTSIGRNDVAGAGAAEIVLRHPLVDAAVVEARPGPLFYQGAGFDICDVAVVLDATDGNAGTGAIGPPDAVAQVLAVITRAARGTVVLNADDAHCRGLAAGVDAWRLCYYGADAGNPVLAGHIRDGGRAVVRENGDGGPVIAVRDGDRRMVLMDAGAVPKTAGGDGALALRNVMAAAAAAYCLGTEAEVIGAAIPTFAATGSTAAEDR